MVGKGTGVARVVVEVLEERVGAGTAEKLGLGVLEERWVEKVATGVGGWVEKAEAVLEQMQPGAAQTTGAPVHRRRHDHTTP